MLEKDLLIDTRLLIETHGSRPGLAWGNELSLEYKGACNYNDGVIYFI